jgi:hypothetical protein
MPQIELEKDIEQKLRIMVERHGGLCLKWVCPGWAGVPDRIVLLPKARIIFVELKRPKGGRVSKMQEWWAKTLTRLGFDHYYVYDADQVNWLERVIVAEEGGL